MSNVDTSGDCWTWTGTRNGSGYGQFQDGSPKGVGAHRWSYEQFIGSATSKVVMHSCDNRLCVKPTHLSAGTHRDNMRDMARKSRGNTAKLTLEQVLDIRARYQRTGHRTSNKRELAEEFGVHPGTIKAIVLRQNWSHV